MLNTIISDCWAHANLCLAPRCEPIGYLNTGYITDHPSKPITDRIAFSASSLRFVGFEFNDTGTDDHNI